MRFMMIVKGNKEAEEGVLPDKKLFSDMQKYNDELAKANVLISLDGFHPSSDGVRVSFFDGKPIVSDGPFPNPEELAAGYWIIETASKGEAIDWAKRIPFQEGVVEIRRIQEISEFPEDIQSVLGEKVSTHNRVIHFEIQADDMERAQKFYETIFGWKINQAMKKEDGGMNYWLIDTGMGQGINGGMYERAGADEKFYLYDCTIRVDDMDKTTEAIKQNGGMITREKSELPNVGFFATVKDTEGNRFGLMQPTKMQPK